jgi:hypothetical protein
MPGRTIAHYQIVEKLARALVPRDTLTAVPGRFIGAMSEYSFNIRMMDLPR